MKIIITENQFEDVVLKYVKKSCLRLFFLVKKVSKKKMLSKFNYTMN